MNSAGLAIELKPAMLGHERLDAYQLAKELDLLAVTVAKRLPRGHAWVADQLLRATGSAVLNIAEASGRSGADRTQHFRIAKGSLFEADAAFDLLVHRALIKPDERARAHTLAVRVAQMLSGLIRG